LDVLYEYVENEEVIVAVTELRHKSLSKGHISVGLAGGVTYVRDIFLRASADSS